MRVYTFDAARRDAERARLGALHQISDDRFVQPLDLDGRLRLDVEHASHVAVGVVADAQCPARCGLLHACGDVDGDAANAAFAIDSAAQQHAAGV
jgi:hypothetical protein